MILIIPQITVLYSYKLVFIDQIIYTFSYYGGIHIFLIVWIIMFFIKKVVYFYPSETKWVETPMSNT